MGKGRMNRLALVISVLVVMLGGCDLLRTPPAATSTAKAGDPLASTTWGLLYLHGNPPLEGTRISLEFSGGFVRGFAGCNTYGRLVIGDDADAGKYKSTPDGGLVIPRLMITALDCPAPFGVMAQEDAYLKALRSAVAFRLVGNRLEMQDAAGVTVLVFAR